MSVHPLPREQRTASIATGVAPPHSIEAEQSVLGAVLLSDRVMRSLILEERLRAEHFFRDRHRLIWQAMCELDDAGAAIDVLTVTEQLRSTGQLETAGGKAAIDELTGGVPGLGGIRRYARIVIEHWVWRQRLVSSYEQQAAILNHAGEQAWQDALNHAHQTIVLGVEEALTGPTAVADRALAMLSEKPTPGLPIAGELQGLARMVRCRPGHVTVIGGWSHHGKSVLAIQVAVYMGAQGHRSVIWTNEDVDEEIIARRLMMVTGVPNVSITDRVLRDLQLGAQRVVRLPIRGGDARLR
ncbi:MAG: hypothetical protein LC798_20760 [Chloroflexi bacterium]|nr:hypothetical protein [Chloroflexota bacterium]